MHPAQCGLSADPNRGGYTGRLFGNQAYSVVVKRGGITGEPVMTVVIQEAGSGSTAEFRPLEPEQSDAVARLIVGC